MMLILINLYKWNILYGMSTIKCPIFMNDFFSIYLFKFQKKRNDVL